MAPLNRGVALIQKRSEVTRQTDNVQASRDRERPEFDGSSGRSRSWLAQGKSMRKRMMKWVFGVAFILAGANHFVHAEFFESIMPPYLPWHRALVYLSGVAEAVLGVMLLIPRFSGLAAWGLIALLIAVFPANLHMAMHPSLYPTFSPIALWLRLPVQGLLIAWAFWLTRPGSSPDGSAKGRHADSD